MRNVSHRNALLTTVTSVVLFVTAIIVFSPSPRAVTLSDPAIYVNAGNGIQTIDSITWGIDRPYATGLYGYIGGQMYQVANPVAGGTILHQSEHYWVSNGQYRFDVPNGQYQVMLKFAELYYGTAGSRIFNVNIQGQRVLTNFDVLAQAGGKFRAIDLMFVVSNTQGRIVVDFLPVKGAPKVNAISVVSLSTSPTVEPTMTPLCYCMTQTPSPIPTPTSIPQPSPTETPTVRPTDLPAANPKRGIGISTWAGDNLSMQMMVDMGFSWGFLWSPNVLDRMQENPNFEVVPLFHMSEVLGSDISGYPAVQYKQGGYIMFLNEPDASWSGDFGYTSTEYATAFHQAWLDVQSVNPGAKWVVGNVMDNADTGRTWLRLFMDAYKGLYGELPPVAGIGIHAYPGTYDKLDWRNRLVDFHNWQVASSWGNLEVWLTEFAMLGSEPASLQLVKDQVTREKWLDGLDWLNRYFWFVSYSGQFAGSVFKLANGKYVADSHTDIGIEFATHP